MVRADDREEIRNYEGPPRSKLARLLRRGLTGDEARLIHDHVTRSVRPDDADIYRLLKPGDTYLDVPEEMRRYRSGHLSRQIPEIVLRAVVPDHHRPHRQGRILVHPPQGGPHTVHPGGGQNPDVSGQLSGSPATRPAGISR